MKSNGWWFLKQNWKHRDVNKHIWVREHIFDVGDTLQWLQSVVASAVCNSVWLARLGMSCWAEQYADTGKVWMSPCFIPSDQHCHAMIVGATSGTLYLVPFNGKPFNMVAVWKQCHLLQTGLPNDPRTLHVHYYVLYIYWVFDFAFFIYFTILTLSKYPPLAQPCIFFSRLV